MMIVYKQYVIRFSHYFEGGNIGEYYVIYSVTKCEPELMALYNYDNISCKEYRLRMPMYGMYLL